MMLYALTGFANYSNRVCRVMDGQSISGYLDIASGYKTFTNINFKNGDGISTTQVVNVEAVDRFAPDYLLVCNDDGHTILSRWYVVECAENRLWQYTLTLRRDLIADNWRNVVDATSRINRGWCSSLNSAIYNPENISVNQIKKDEVLLKDTTNSGWIVGYVADNAHVQDERIVASSEVVDYIEEDEVAKYFADNKRCIYSDVPIMNCIFRYNVSINLVKHELSISNMGSFDFINENIPIAVQAFTVNKGHTDDLLDFAKEHQFDLDETLADIVEERYRYRADDFDQYVGKFIREPSGRIYKLEHDDFFHIDMSLTETQSDYIKNYYYDLIKSLSYVTPSTGLDDRNCELMVSVGALSIKKTYVDGYDVAVTFSDNRPKLRTRPYCMFAIPFHEASYIFNGSEYTSDPRVCFAVANEISRTLGTGLIDMQLLPYFPRREIIDDGAIDLDMIGSTDRNIIIDASNPNKRYGFIVWCTDDSSNIMISDNPINTTTNTLEMKTKTIIDKYRLVSPNYASMYEFSPYMNDGVIGWNASFTYKPYNPFIRVTPIFSGLYGKDFNDARGLICGGDFSLPQISDAWTQYQMNHKNYDLQFNREIESLETNQKYGLISSGMSLAGSLVSSFVNPTGNGMLGVGASLANGLMSYQQAENNINDKKYLHKLEMENIQAQPNTITKVGAQDINNKIFPILELYSCTDEEVESVKAYLNNFSFTINRQGKIRDYLRSGVRTWIEADLIAVPDFKGDAHELMELKNELTKGVYIV